MVMKALLFVAVLASVAAAFTVSYEGHQVLRFRPESREQLDHLNALEIISHLPRDYDFWKAASAVGAFVDLRVSPGARDAVLSYSALKGLKPEILIDDLQEYFLAARNAVGDTWDQSYHNLDDINNWMNGLIAANPSFVSQIKVGTTYEGRTIYGLKVTQGSGSLPQIYLDGGIHAREWMAPAVMQYIMGQLVNHASNYSSYLKQFEWYLVPVFNCDGYVYTWKTDPNWRKNRQPNAGSACIGTDPCRNADAGFGGDGSSNQPCSDTYHGTAAWSAPMMAGFRDYIKALPRLKGYINFHSYAESWLDPYGYTASKPADYTLQEANAKNATAAIKAVHGQTYAYGPAYTTIYPASGVPSDWVYDSLKVKLSQAVELRGNSFQPSPSLIQPIGEELMAGVLKLADDILANNL